MFEMKFLDGTPVDKEYEELISKVCSTICDMEEKIGIEELERFATLTRRKENE